MKKIIDYTLLILIIVLLMKIFVFGEQPYQKNKIEYSILMLIGLYYLIINFLNKKYKE